MRWSGCALALAMVGLVTAGCGSAAPRSGQHASSAPPAGSSSKKPAALPVTLAPGASPLCAQGPVNPHLAVTLDGPGVTTPQLSSGTLQAINYNNAQEGDGPFVPASIGGRLAIQVMPGHSNGKPNNWGELYFTTNGAVPAATHNVELCIETYDASAGDVLAANFSGTNPKGAQGGAYDAAPQAYVTAGTDRWLTVSFQFDGINFASGDTGAGAENAQADFRVQVGPPLTGDVYFDRAWLITTGVPSGQSLAATPGATNATKL